MDTFPELVNSSVKFKIRFVWRDVVSLGTGYWAMAVGRAVKLALNYAILISVTSICSRSGHQIC